MQPVVHLILGAFKQVAERVRALELYEFVRVLRAAHAQNLDLEVKLFEDADGALRGLDARADGGDGLLIKAGALGTGESLAGAVVIVGDDDLAFVARDQPRLLRRKRCAERGDCRVEARLMQRNYVYIALR